jgi:hypothetical protein
VCWCRGRGPLEHPVELAHAARDLIALHEALLVLGRHQPGEDPQTARPDHIVVVSPPEAAPAHLEDPQPPPFRAVGDGELFETNDAVHEAVEVGVVHLLREVVHDSSCSASG